MIISFEVLPARAFQQARISLFSSVLRGVVRGGPLQSCWSSAYQPRWERSYSQIDSRTGIQRQSFRLFGSKPGPNSLPGDIYLEDNQSALKIDIDRLKETASKIRASIGYNSYDICLFLVDDEEMQDANHESRGIDAPTDILSFPFHPAIRPGKLAEPDFDIPDYYNLGDILIDIPYVIRRCQEDEEYETDDDDEERGVSGAMANVYDTEQRIHMLLIHGMLHLVGHDHETDEEYQLMVAEEERLLKELGFQTK